MARKAKRDRTIEQQLAHGPIDLPFLALVLLLTALGLIMVLSASYASAMYNLDASVDTGGDPYYYFKRQLVFALLGIVALFILSRIDYQQLRWLSVFALGGSIVLLILVFTPLGRAAGDTDVRRWINLFGIRFQPSEVAKVGVILYFSARLSKRDSQVGPPKKWNRRSLAGRVGEVLDRIGLLELVPYVAILIVVLFLLYKEPHMSGMILIIVAAASVLFASGIGLHWFIGGGTLVVAALAFLITQTQYMTNRITIWLDPFQDPRNLGFQPIQSMTAIGSGGLLGVGLGNSTQKYLFLPEEHNDCIFAIICEEMGMVGACVVMALFALLIIRGYWLAIHARDRFGTLLIVGIISLLATQTFLNIGVATNAIPTTGISLPFFSYGGTALLIQLAEMGIVLSVSRQIAAPKAE